MIPKVAAIIVVFSTVLIVPLFLRAQFIPDSLSIIATPSSPSPGQEFRVEAATPTFDRNTALFDWRVDGKARPDLSGVGQSSITLKAPAVIGSVTRASVTVSRLDGTQNSLSLSVPVSELSLVWYAHTLVPAWYKGKALPSQSSNVDVTALPEIISDGQRIAPENLIYHWNVDDADTETSGVGQNTFRIRTSEFPRVDHTIKVRVEDLDKKIQKTRTLFLIPVAPRAAIYTLSPLGGIESRSALISSATIRGIMDFLVEPFFFSAKSKKNLSYQWKIGQAAARGTPENPFLLTLDASGISRLPDPSSLSVSVKSSQELTPAATKSIKLETSSEEL